MTANEFNNQLEDEKWLQKAFHDNKETLWPREAGEFVAKHTKVIKLNEKKVDEVAEMVYEEIKAGAFEKGEFNEHELHPKFDDPERMARWVLFIDSVNYCFWHGYNKGVEYNGKTYTGYYFGAACLKRALDDHGIDVTEPSYMIRMDTEKFEKLFRGKLPMGLSHLRARSIAEAGRVILEKYDGKVLNLLKAADNSAVKLVKILDNPKASSLVNFTDFGELTMFADYRVPQIMCHLGVLEYSKQFQDILKRFTPIRKGSRTEVAIRGMSIYACDELTKKVKQLEEKLGKLHRPVTAADIDVFLWLKRREIPDQVEKTTPHHRVVTWFY
ncbi:unnamed protein product [Bursaphelenchus okinawaensis]|uniref:Queuosine 5'-phosphate N-glycosylase/hydrolase n=1 Tax=Bursaphelenchus okinawaensis TaxID=465554 RepID=A0A811KSK7_9BILA|nr:unnamed protein product [Bursaphelenchus okinawaensis]CAG9111099.1 unnamed protein product [Bursaphelenchus okinawaensis]